LGGSVGGGSDTQRVKLAISQLATKSPIKFKTGNGDNQKIGNSINASANARIRSQGPVWVRASREPAYRPATIAAAKMIIAVAAVD